MMAVCFATATGWEHMLAVTALMLTWREPQCSSQPAGCTRHVTDASLRRLSTRSYLASRDRAPVEVVVDWPLSDARHAIASPCQQRHGVDAGRRSWPPHGTAYRARNKRDSSGDRRDLTITVGEHWQPLREWWSPAANCSFSTFDACMERWPHTPWRGLSLPCGPRVLCSA